MKSPHLLNLGNPRKVKDNLSELLNAAALQRIESEIEKNTRALIALARNHYRFASGVPANWRQKVSRLYYAGYNAARAVPGCMSTVNTPADVRDHQKFDTLPDDFPSRDRYSNQLAVLREDRNTCDYDHLSLAADLALGSRLATELVGDFLADVAMYLNDRALEM